MNQPWQGRGIEIFATNRRAFKISSKDLFTLIFLLTFPFFAKLLFARLLFAGLFVLDRSPRSIKDSTKNQHFAADLGNYCYHAAARNCIEIASCVVGSAN